MANIHILDQQIAELIAAGEVVERPSSVIKELLENSIDAKSNLITVEIQHGGITYIRVSDNGCGIDAKDVPLVFHRHATSKIYKEEDLEHISTLGFRGEAMASIAAVSRVEMMTCTHDAIEGTYYEIHGGVEQSISEVGCPAGTTLIVRDLFYNTPARMKFLKKDNSEANSVAAIIEKVALSHPEISFKLIRDGQVKLHTPGDGKLLSAIHAVLGYELALGMIPVEYKSNAIKVTGYVCKPANSRGNRTMQNFFINSRYVKSKTMMAALEEAYKHSIMVGKFPSCVLDLKIPYQEVDVNVHPAKIEVRFSDEKSVFDAVYYGVKSALKQHDDSLGLTQENYGGVQGSAMRWNMRSSPLSDEKESSIRTDESPKAQDSPSQKHRYANILHSYANAESFAQEAPLYNMHKAASNLQDLGDSLSLHSHPVPYQTVQRASSGQSIPFQEVQDNGLPVCMKGRGDSMQQNVVKEASPEELVAQAGDAWDTVYLENACPPQEKPIRMIGELFGTYILLEANDKLILIDKHAAHERILFERLKKIDTTKDQQLLLNPLLVHLSQEDYAAVCGNMSIFERIGFEVEDFGNADLYVRAIPAALPECDIGLIVEEAAHKLCLHHHDLTPEILDDLLHNIACRSAIKAHDKNTPIELEEIIRMLQDNEDIKYCPHGRPIARTLSRRDIEKMFGRIQ